MFRSPIHIQTLKLHKMRPHNPPPINRNPRYNNPNLQNPRNIINDPSLFISVDELNKLKIFTKSNINSRYISINKFVLFFKCEAC